MRMRKKPWTESELKINKNIVYEASEYKGRWNEFFDNRNDIYLEIGCGKGRFILKSAMKNTCINYIGMERKTEILAFAARKCREENAPVVLISADAGNITNFFASGEIKRIYINFCDPWPNKKKWGKRRLTNGNYLDLYKEIMGGSGEIFFKTDNRELFEYSIEQFSAKNWTLKNVSLDLHNIKNANKSFFLENVSTEYEEKFVNKSMPIYRLEAYIE